MTQTLEIIAEVISTLVKSFFSLRMPMRKSLTGDNKSQAFHSSESEISLSRLMVISL